MAEKLNKHEQEVISEMSAVVNVHLYNLELIKSLSKFKLDDYLIAFVPPNDYNSLKKQQAVNTFGAAKKYKVVHVDPYGIPYMKELNKYGKTFGQLLCPLYRRGNNELYIQTLFEVDPDYEDSILLDDEGSFDAVKSIKDKSDLHKEIVKHNKSLRIKIKTTQDLINFISTIKVGDTIWRTPSSALTITEISPTPINTIGKLIHDKRFIKVTNHKGITLDLAFKHLKSMAIYKDRPRTFNELKIPK